MQPLKLMPVQIPVYRGCVWDLLPATQVVPKPQVQVSAVSLKKRNQTRKDQKGTRTVVRGKGEAGSCVFKLLFWM